MSKVWSKEQEKILNFIKNEKDNLIVRAVAGSGKTSVLVEAAEYVPRGSIFVAFNKKIVGELVARLPAHVPATTFHALCFQFLRDRLPRGLQVDKFKNLRLAEKVCKDIGEAKWEVNRLVGLLKNLGVGVILPYDLDLVEEVRENYDISSDNATNNIICETAVKVMKRGVKELDKIDFDDMVYMALHLVISKGWAMDQYETVFLDEAQDTNAVQLHLLEKMCKRLVAVGDDWQAIYGFRGAGSNSMPDIEEQFACVNLPMTISWRCPVLARDIVQKYVPHFQCRDDAPLGEVLFIPESDLFLGYHAGNLILCRMNYPLFKVAIDLLKRRIPFNMSGSFPSQLISFVEGFKASGLPDLRKKLEAWWIEKERDLSNRGKTGLLAREFDKYQCILGMIKECDSPAGLVAFLRQMTQASGGVSLTTIHGAKGLEAETVVILNPELIPSEYASTKEQLQQEENLRYVAETRSKFRLVYCSDK